MLVRDKMTPKVITITPDQSLLIAKERLQKHGVRRLPVVRDGALVGIVTDQHVRQAWASPATSLSTHELLCLLEQVMVEEVMTPHPPTVAPETPLLEAARLLRDRSIGGLTVVEGGRVVGIITESDLLGAFSGMFEGDKDAPTPASNLVS